MSNLKLLGALLLTVGGTTQLLYAEQPSVIINSNIVQQKSTCSGVVKDASGESVIGASVLVKGTTIGTITDFDGNFERQGRRHRGSEGIKIKIPQSASLTAPFEKGA